MNKQGKLDKLDEQIIYFYRNNFPTKEICKKTGEKISKIQYRISKMKKYGLLKRWWE